MHIKISAFNIWRGVSLQQTKVVAVQNVDKRSNVFNLAAVSELTGFNCKRLFLKWNCQRLNFTDH